MLRGFISVCALALATSAFAAEPQNAAHALAQKFAQQSEPAKTERPPLDYEMEMLRRARAEQAAAKASAKAQPVAAPIAAAIGTPAALPSVNTETQPTASPPQAAKTTQIAQPDAPPKAEIQAKVETKPTETPSSAGVTSAPAARASMLLALETGGTSSKGGATASFDPILCMDEACFVSAGLESDAVPLTKADALKLKSTSEASPDSCKGKTACVFRNVAVAAKTQIKVLELGSPVHESVLSSDAQLDTSCKMLDGDLACDNPVATPDFRVWVVPEETARKAGVQAIEDAVADGLPHEDIARDTDK